MSLPVKVIVIGGSAGCLPVLKSILQQLPEGLTIPVIVVLHRLKNVVSEMDKILGNYVLKKAVIEPDDKEPIQRNRVYLAPQNYHLLVEADHSFSLDYSEPVHYSRPSIDVTFESAANVFTSGVLCILLSGASTDGTAGIECVLNKKGIAIVQEPATAEFSVMPKNALDHNLNAIALTPSAITDYLHSITV